MNISLSGANKKKKKGSIGYGLNQRGTSAGVNISDAFDGSSSSDDDGDQTSSNHRSRVNQQIAKEQDALRKRAQIAASSVDVSVYDYDCAYESFQSATNAETSKEPVEERKSRYIGDLLKAAKKRERERDVVYERKVAKEQAEEDVQADYQGKEKFVTRAYKRKLEERKQWELEEKRKEDEEEQNDVTKKVGGAALASFYGNFNRNVAIGGVEERDKDGKEEDSPEHYASSQTHQQESSHKGNMGFLDGFKRDDTATPSAFRGSTDHGMPEDGQNKPRDVPAMSLRERREKKVAEARRRYLDRRAAAALQ